MYAFGPKAKPKNDAPSSESMRNEFYSGQNQGQTKVSLHRVKGEIKIKQFS
jgi:hypothetical protein